MSTFRFRLERVLEWRRLQLQEAEARWRQQRAALAALERARAGLESEGKEAESRVREWNPLAGGDLSALEAFRRDVQRRRDRLSAEQQVCLSELATRQSALLESQRRCRLLERLKQRRQDEWREAHDRELQELASESYLARWKRE